jgi:hypothetical protein
MLQWAAETRKHSMIVTSEFPDYRLDSEGAEAIVVAGWAPDTYPRSHIVCYGPTRARNA